MSALKGEQYYAGAVDGSEYCHATKLVCAGCLRHRSAKGEIPYSHLVVAATVTRAGSHESLPLEAAEVRNAAGQQPQACALTAAKRVVKRLRAEQRPLQLCLTGDDLYAPEPFIQEVRQLRMGFVLVAKPTSHEALFAGVEERERQGEGGRGRWEEGAGSRRRSFAYRSAAHVPRTHSGTVRVNVVEVWERAPAGPVRYHNAWVTDFALTPETVATILGSGRSRWKIENEQFTVQKNHGYELEHNYGHGQQTLSMVFYTIKPAGVSGP